MDEDEYWNDSPKKAFNFDDDETEIAIPKSDRKLFADDNISESSYELPTNETPLHHIISERNLKMIIDEQSMNWTKLPIINQERPSIQTAVNWLLLKKPISLELFRSLSDKEALLDEAISSGNGDAILQIVLFILRTLKRQLAQKLIEQRPVAVTHYLNYLVDRSEINECSDWLIMLGQHNEAALLQYNHVMRQCCDPNQKRQKLIKIHTAFFTQPGVLDFYTKIVQNYKQLIDWQLADRSSNLNDSSVLECLLYAGSKHKWSDTTSQSHLNPTKLSETYNVSAAQYEWCMLNERARSQAWKDLEQSFERKSWHNIKATFQIHLPVERVVMELFRLEAPGPILRYFLQHVDNATDRLTLARKINETKSIADALAELKLKDELDSLIESLQIGTPERFYVENVTKNLGTSWKVENMKIIKQK